MNEAPFPVARLFDATNEAVRILNAGDRDGVIRQLQSISDEFYSLCPVPISAHLALHTLAQCMFSSGTLARHGDFLSKAAYCPDRDMTMRQSVNEACALLNQNTPIEIARDALERCVATHIQENVIYPHMEDVFKLLRTLSVALKLPNLQLPIDRARYHSSCISSEDSFRDRPTGETDVLAHETPGFRLVSQGDCPICAVIEKFGVYEPTSTQVWASLATKADIIVDIGAHVGFYALLAASVNATAIIHAFEPNPDAYRRLCENVQLNGYSNLACHPVAAAKEAGSVEFQYLASDKKHLISTVGSSTGRLWDGGKTITVTTQCLDDLGIVDRLEADSPGRPLIKIDTEGKEGDVLEGACQTIAAALPDIVVESFDTSACEQINRVLTPHGYRFFRIIEGAHRLVEMEKMKPAFLSHLEDFNTLATTRSNEDLGIVLPKQVVLDILN